MSLPVELQTIVDRIAARTKQALSWPSTQKVKKALSDNLADVQSFAAAVAILLTPVPVPVPVPVPPDPIPVPLPPVPSSGQLQKSQLKRVGFIRLPLQRVGVSTFERGGFTPGIAFNPSGNGGKGSLFVTGQDTDTNIGGPTAAEVDIPPPGATRLSAPVANFLQPFAAFDEGVIARDTPQQSASEPWHQPITLGDIEVGPDSKLYATWYINYDSTNALQKFIFRRPLDLSDTGKVEGGLGPAKVSAIAGGALGRVPAAWVQKLRGTWVSGMTGVSIISRCSQGPSACVWYGADFGIGGILQYTPLQFYPFEDGKRLAYYEGMPGLIPGVPVIPWNDQPYWSGGVFFGHGCCIPEGYDSLLQFYTFGQSAWHYGVDPSDTANPGQGNHAPPYRNGLYVTDLHQLEDVANGTRQSWQVVPHALWDITPLLLESGENIGTGHPYMSQGLTHDPVNKRIYVKRPSGDPVAADTAIVVVLSYA